jgi:hypothetical protein
MTMTKPNDRTIHLAFDHAQPERDQTMFLLQALDDGRTMGEGTTLVLEKETYHFYPDHMTERYYSPSNNDSGMVRIAFPLIGFRGLTIDGNGAKLLFHGRISPFVIDGSEGITVKNLIIDNTRPMYSQGTIVDSDPTGLTLEIDKDLFPHRVEGGHLVFYGENWENDLSDILPLIQEYDPATRAPGYGTPTLLAKFGPGDQPTDSQPAPIFVFDVRLLDETEQSSRIRLQYVQTAAPYTFTKGYVLTIQHEKRLNSAFFINDSTDTVLQNVRIVTTGSMGVIAQLSENITINGLDISLGSDSKGLISVNADATHFVNCTGTVRIENSRLENMLDDGTNIHGIYTRIEAITAPDELVTRISHYQQFGLNVYKPGDRISLIGASTVRKTGEAEVLSSTFDNDEQSLIRIRFRNRLPEGLRAGDLIENDARMPDAVLRNNITGSNRPRGFLISTPGNVRIEGNTFHNSHYAIHITGDANYWFESGPVRNVLITDNRFCDCCYMGGDYVIAVTPEFPVNEEDPIYYHRNIAITGNTFEMFQEGLLTAYSVDTLIFRDNTYRRTDTYPVRTKNAPVRTDRCIRCDIEEPRIIS